MSVRLLSTHELACALAVRDLTDPAEGRHAIQRLLDDAVRALSRHWSIPTIVRRGTRIVDRADNYDALGYPPDAVTRDARYTKYVTADHVLRSHTTALVPGALRDLGRDREPRDLLLVCPGVVYRRDAIDRLHAATPHQCDLWRVARDIELTAGDLKEMIEIVVAAVLPGADHRVESRVHPYTTDGLQIDVANGDDWVEIGECGRVAPEVLSAANVEGTGLAMGLGLDRILMLRKGIADIRLLRATDRRVAGQMVDCSLYRPVSAHPALTRDISIAVDAGDTVEDLGDRVRDALGPDADAVESVSVRSETPVDALPDAARERLGAIPGQRNVLVRIVLRHPERTLTREEANGLRDRVCSALHRGLVPQ